MRSSHLVLAALLLPAAVAAQEAPSPARLKADVEKLVSFGTRHTGSDATHPTRGIGAARRWFQSELDKTSKACGGCIQTSMIERVFTNDRLPKGANVVDVLGIQPGTDANRVVIVMGHIDSRVTDVLNMTADAPGANDDASGTALVLEAARLLSKEKFVATIVYAALSGEEQGLLGGRLLADTAKQRGWTVTAVLNNDIVGNTKRQADGAVVADRVRVFSEGIESAAALDMQMVRRSSGGEDDSPSRVLAKTVRDVAKTMPGALEVVTVRRPDRFGRGGDHTAFLEAGFPAAVRFSVGLEDFAAQHQDLRPNFGDTVDKMDFPYLAKVTAINVATLRQLAAAPATPETVTLAPAYAEAGAGQSNFGRVVTGTKISWQPVTGATGYRVYWKRADKYEWTGHIDVAGGTTAEAVLNGVIVDDTFLGVSALGANGSESMVSFGGIPLRRSARPPA